MATNLPAPPLDTPIVEIKAGFGRVLGAMTKEFANWLQVLIARAQTVAVAIATISYTAQTATLGLTPIVAVASGTYRISWHIQVTTPATTSSLLIVAVTTTTNGVTATQTAAALVSNSSGVPASGVFIVRADAGAPVSIAVTYASVGATVAVWAAQFIAEQML